MARLAVFSWMLVAALGGCRRNPACEATDPISVELCGPRSEWIGQWIAVDSPARSLDIGPHGGFHFRDPRPMHLRDVEGDIVAFEGDNLVVQTSAGERVLIRVTVPPHADGDGWNMTAEGATLQRSAHY